MTYELYLLYMPSPNPGWGVFTKDSCPDVGFFKGYEHMYRLYEFNENDFNKVFNRLYSVMEKLEKDKIVPSKENQEKIFPKLEELLK